MHGVLADLLDGDRARDPPRDLRLPDPARRRQLDRRVVALATLVLVRVVEEEAVVAREVEVEQSRVHVAATPDDADFMTQLLPNNIVGVYNIMEAARLGGARRMIICSSGQVNWGQRFTGPWPVRADEPVTPRYWYAAAKVFLEAAGRAYADAHGLSVIVARLGWCPRTVEQVQEMKLPNNARLLDGGFQPDGRCLVTVAARGAGAAASKDPPPWRVSVVDVTRYEVATHA